MKRTVSILISLIILALTVTSVIPSAFAVSADIADTGEYEYDAPILNLTSAAKGVFITWNAEDGIDHFQVYKKTSDGWEKIADNITSNSYFDTSAIAGDICTYAVRGLSALNEWLTSFNNEGTEITFIPNDILYLLGDVDMDGNVTIMDATRIQNVLAKLYDDVNGYVTKLASLAGTELSIMDATSIQRYLAHLSISSGLGDMIVPLKSVTDLLSEPFIGYLIPNILSTETIQVIGDEHVAESYDEDDEGHPHYIKTITIDEENFIKVTWDKIEGAFCYIPYLKENGVWKALGCEFDNDALFPISYSGTYEISVLGIGISIGVNITKPDDAAQSVSVRYFIDQMSEVVYEGIEETTGYDACSKCGADVGGYISKWPDKIDEWYEKYLEYFYDGHQVTREPDTKEQFSKWCVRQFHCLVEGCSSKYHNVVIRTYIGENITNYPQKGHFEIV